MNGMNATPANGAHMADVHVDRIIAVKQIDACRESMLERPDLDFRLEYPESPFNIGERFIASDDFIRRH